MPVFVKRLRGYRESAAQQLTLVGDQLCHWDITDMVICRVKAGTVINERQARLLLNLWIFHGRKLTDEERDAIMDLEKE